MGGLSTFVIVIIVVIVLLILWLVGLYNGLVRGRNQYKNAFAQIDVQLKRRYDLIPNLVETAKAYLKHESQTLQAVTEARNVALGANRQAAANPGDPSAMRALAGAEGELTGALGRLIATFEAYPDLKANQNILAVQEELTTTENKVAFARQAFNDAVTSYNNGREVFPTVLVAGMFGFHEAALLEIENKEERGAPKVQF